MSTPITELMARLQSSVITQRQQAAQELLLMDGLANEAAVPLCLATADDDETVRETATAALEQLGPPPHGLLPALADLLNDTHGDVAYWAATLLGRAAESDAAVADRLAAAVLQHPIESVRERAVWALGKIAIETPRVRAALADAASSNTARLARLAQHAVDELPED